MAMAPAVLGGLQRDVSFPALLGILQALHHSIYLRLQAKHVLKLPALKLGLERNGENQFTNWFVCKESIRNVWRFIEPKIQLVRYWRVIEGTSRLLKR